MKDQKGFVHVITLLFIVLVIGVGGWWMWRNGHINIAVERPMTNPAPTTQEIPDDWKTYTVEEHQFEFEHPNNLEVYRYQQSDHTTYEFGTIGLFQSNFDLNGYAFSIEIYEDKSKGWINVGNYKKEDCSNAYTLCSEIKDSHIADTKTKTYNIIYTDGPNTRKLSEYYFERNDRLFKITVLSSTPKNTTNNYPIQKIINSIRFLNQTNPEFTKFFDESFDLSFVHPITWRIESTFDGGGDGGDISQIINFSLDRYFYGNIKMEDNQNNYSPKVWFETEKKQEYTEFIKEIDNFSIDGNPAIAYATPNSCKTAPMYVAFIKKDKTIYEIMYIEEADRSRASDLETILKTLKFAESDRGNVNDIPEFVFPAPPANLECN